VSARIRQIPKKWCIFGNRFGNRFVVPKEIGFPKKGFNPEFSALPAVSVASAWNEVFGGPRSKKKKSFGMSSRRKQARPIVEPEFLVSRRILFPQESLFLSGVRLK
jgi:hypothetical protein